MIRAREYSLARQQSKHITSGDHILICSIKIRNLLMMSYDHITIDMMC